MKLFKIKKGGDVENPQEAIVVLNRDVDEELLKKAINICAENGQDVSETIEYIRFQFNCVELVNFNDLNTFYC